MRGTLLLFGLSASLLAAQSGIGSQQSKHRPPEQSPRVVACRVRESHTSLNPATGVLVFSQRDKVDAERLSGLLRSAQDGGAVEFQTNEGGAWVPASIVRLKSCFGRGLLILPAGETPPAEGSTFLLRFPAASLKPARARVRVRQQVLRKINKVQGLQGTPGGESVVDFASAAGAPVL